jgi:hypothetical protein
MPDKIEVIHDSLVVSLLISLEYLVYKKKSHAYMSLKSSFPFGIMGDMKTHSPVVGFAYYLCSAHFTKRPLSDARTFT